MGANSLIEWTDHAFSGWFGCTKVSPACDCCYAEGWTVRRFHKAGWGPHEARVRAADSTWAEPLAWQRKAVREGRRRRVFAFELADVFDNRARVTWRADLWALVARCPDLDWLILTKRPQNFRTMLPADWGDGWQNVWLGVTAENQREWRRRVSLLRRTHAAVRFVSVEPMLEPIDADLEGIDWVICGGEDKTKTPRVMNPDWARDLLQQCRSAGVAFFMKQMTRKGPIPPDLLVREFPSQRQIH